MGVINGIGKYPKPKLKVFLLGLYFPGIRLRLKDDPFVTFKK
jgi:hypothetical protein